MSTESLRLRRAAAAAVGKCTNCMRRKAVNGRSRCRRCLDYQNDWQKEHYAERVAAKLCAQCGLVPPVEGEQRCAGCKAKKCDLQDAWIEERRQGGVCLRCPRKATPGHDECRRCRKRAHRKRSTA